MWITRIDRKTGKQVGNPTRMRSEVESLRTDAQIMKDDQNARAQNPNQQVIRDYFNAVGWDRYHIARVPEGKQS